MVRTVLIASVLLLGVGTAGAMTVDEWFDMTGAVRVTLSDSPTEEELGQAIVYAASQHDPCLDKMEQAMRAMDLLVTDGVRWGVKSQELTARTLWQDTKSECWAKP